MKLTEGLPLHEKRARRGFTMVEMIIVIVVLGTMLSVALPRANSGIRQRRVISASTALHSDIPVAFSLAARQRKPVVLRYDAASGELRVTNRAADTVFLRRPLKGTSEYKLDSVAMSPATVQLLPNGVSSSAFTIRLANGSFVRRLSVGRTGLSRVAIN